jgi:hypothetical protein
MMEANKIMEPNGPHCFQHHLFPVPHVHDMELDGQDLNEPPTATAPSRPNQPADYLEGLDIEQEEMDHINQSDSESAVRELNTRIMPAVSIPTELLP